MKPKLLSLLTILALVAMLVPVLPVAAQGPDENVVLAPLVLLSGASGGLSSQGRADQNLPIPVTIDDQLKGRPAPQQPTVAEAEAAVTAGATSGSQCAGNDDTLTITITSFDPANPGAQDVVFFRETAADAPGKATLWVAWDFLTTASGRVDVITCDQLATLQAAMDKIVSTDVKYFGAYDQRPAGNENIDVMIYNIVDESYFDPEFPSYIAGFFWGSINETFDRNMIFIDSYDWVNRLGPDVRRPYLYESTVAHELEHLIHNDHDADEDSWVDEGLADLAGYLNGFGHEDGHVVYYLAFHRTPLTVWGGGLESYGASYLFQLYLLENFGAKAADGSWESTWTRKIVDEQANSIDGVEAATSAAMNDLYDSWILANYMDNPSLSGAGDFPLGYDTIDLAPYNSPAYGPWSIALAIGSQYSADHHGNLPVSRYFGGYQSGTVEYPIGALAPYTPWYGSYKGIAPEMLVRAAGDSQSGVAPHAGDYEAASGGGHMLTDRTLSLNTPVGGTLTFWTWFDIEEEWDYGFVEASTDSGATWMPLPGSITRTSNNPNNSTAWANSLVAGQASTDAAITGNSADLFSDTDGWVEATFTLPAAGNVLVRFNYYTDEASNGQGWFIDDVTVNGVIDGFEAGAANWTLGGWAVTTGLFSNDWLMAYMNPIYQRGKFSSLEWGYVPGTAAGTSEQFGFALNTANLGNDEAILVLSNRPRDSVFEAGYLLLVSKGNARK